MDNHIHLLLYSSPYTLSSFFQSLGTRFVRWYNTKYSRSGHLFQERFHSYAIENDSFYLATLVYIHNNPVKANACRYPSEYRWSSYNAFYGQKNHLVNVSFSYGVAGSKQTLLKYFAACNDTENATLFNDCHKDITHFITDAQALSIFKDITNLPSTSAAQNIPKKIRNEYIVLLRQNHLTQNQIARIMDISVSTVKRVCRE